MAGKPVHNYVHGQIGRNQRANLFLIEEMRRYNQVPSFDEQPRPELNSEAIGFRTASEFFKPIRRLTAQSYKLSKS